MHQQKLKVNYLPQEGQTVEEEDENLPANSAFTVGEQVSAVYLHHNMRLADAFPSPELQDCPWYTKR